MAMLVALHVDRILTIFILGLLRPEPCVDTAKSTRSVVRTDVVMTQLLFSSATNNNLNNVRHL